MQITSLLLHVARDVPAAPCTGASAYAPEAMLAPYQQLISYCADSSLYCAWLYCKQHNPSRQADAVQYILVHSKALLTPTTQLAMANKLFAGWLVLVQRSPHALYQLPTPEPPRTILTPSCPERLEPSREHLSTAQLPRAQAALMLQESKPTRVHGTAASICELKSSEE